MTTSSLWGSYFEPSSLFGAQLEFVLNEVSRLGRLRRGSSQGFRLGSDVPLPVGVVFFPNIPFMGVMLFPSFVLCNASGGSGAFLVPLFPFFFLFFLFIFFILLLFPTLSSSLSHYLFLSSPFPSPSLLSFALFFFEGTACTVYL